MCVYILVLLFWILYKTCEFYTYVNVCYTFGRGLHCDVVIEQDMTNVKVDTLSRIHCTIRRDEHLKPDRHTVGQVSSFHQKDNSAFSSFH
jgi:pSer/pThr/pTyr-binding forkhead associated (FHA) protein